MQAISVWLVKCLLINGEIWCKFAASTSGCAGICDREVNITSIYTCSNYSDRFVVGKYLLWGTYKTPLWSTWRLLIAWSPLVINGGITIIITIIVQYSSYMPWRVLGILEKSNINCTVKTLFGTGTSTALEAFRSIYIQCACVNQCTHTYKLHVYILRHIVKE